MKLVFFKSKKPTSGTQSKKPLRVEGDEDESKAAASAPQGSKGSRAGSAQAPGDQPSKRGGKPPKAGAGAKADVQPQDDWRDGEAFGARAKDAGGNAARGGHGAKTQAGGAAPGANDGERAGGSPAGAGRLPGDGESASAGKGAKVDFRVEPHEDGDGHRVHFHEDVHANIPSEADYQHHVTEHAKHFAGYQIHKTSDPKRAEAHRHAANLHARVGNALHAADVVEPKPEPGAGLMIDPLTGKPLPAPGAPGSAPGQPKPPGAGGPPAMAAQGQGAGVPGAPPGAAGPQTPTAVPSPGKDAMGGPLPGMPDGQRNAPGQDSTMDGRQKKFGKSQPRLVFLAKSGGPFIGPKGGKWADAAHTIPWVEHEVKLTQKQTYTPTNPWDKSAKTMTHFVVEDPSRPGGVKEHRYATEAHHPDVMRADVLKQHAERHKLTNVVHSDKPTRGQKAAETRKRNKARDAAHEDVRHSTRMDKLRERFATKNKSMEELATRFKALNESDAATQSGAGAREELLAVDHELKLRRGSVNVPTEGKHRIATVDGVGEVDTVHRSGLYAVHKVPEGSDYVISHTPTGLRIMMGKKGEAVARAKHMHAHAGDAGKDASFGKNDLKQEDLKRIRDAHESYKKSFSSAPLLVVPIGHA